MRRSTVYIVATLASLGPLMLLQWSSTQRSSKVPRKVKHISEVGGLVMVDEGLVDAVRLAVSPPASPMEPYNLKKPNKIRRSQYGQDELVEKIFKGKKNGFFFEVGALDGEEYSNSLYFERQLGWTGVLVEPIPPSFYQLMKTRRKAFALNACLSPNTSASELLLGFKKGASLAQFKGSSGGPNTYRVMCVPLFTILQALGNPTVDYLSLDIEGHELKILKTVPWNRVNIRLVGIEINHLPEGPQAVMTYMENQGFKFYKMNRIDYFFYKPELAADMDLGLIDTKKRYPEPAVH